MFAFDFFPSGEHFKTLQHDTACSHRVIHEDFKKYHNSCSIRHFSILSDESIDFTIICLFSYTPTQTTITRTYYLVGKSPLLSPCVYLSTRPISTPTHICLTAHTILYACVC